MMGQVSHHNKVYLDTIYDAFRLLEVKQDSYKSSVHTYKARYAYGRGRLLPSFPFFHIKIARTVLASVAELVGASSYN